jgi:hypothetical protein
VGSVFGPFRFLLPVCRICWCLYTFNIHLYMHIFRRIFLRNNWWRESDTNIRSLPSIVAEKNEHICSMCIKINKVGKHEVGIWWVQTFVYAYFSSHFSKEQLMTGIWYLVTSFIYVCHIVGSIFWTRQIPTSCLPKSGGIIGWHFEFHVHITLTWTCDRLMNIIVHHVQLLLSRNSLHKYQASFRVI